MRRLITLAGLAICLIAQPTHAVTVCPTGCDYTTINAALNGAPPGDPIVVDPGTYSEPRLNVSGRTLSSTQPTNPSAATITNNDGRAVIQASNATIEGFTITGGNNAGGHGGGVSVTGGDVLLRHVIIEGNSADSGGGVGGITGSTDVTIENSTIRNNTASNRGGGVEGVPGETTITDSVITNNTVNKTSGTGIGSGGGVYLPSSSSGLIRNTQITMNQASGTARGYGAGIFSAANLILSGVTLQTNTAADGSFTAWGGGLYISRLGSTNVYGGSFSSNSAGRGGGVYVGSGSAVVSINTSVTGNTATQPIGNGGGIYCGGPIQTLAGNVSGNSLDDIVGCGSDVNPPTGTTRTAADNEQSGNSNDPVNTRTGELYNQYAPDIDLSGPMPLFFARYYSSGFKQVGIFANMGDNWRHNFDWRLSLIGSTIHILDHRGRTIQFSQNGPAWDLSGKTDVAYQLDENAGLYTLLDPRDRRSYVFDSTGLLISISDGRGNMHTLTYANGPLTQVTDGLGRVLNFTYDAGSYLSGIDDGLGRSVGFTYTGSYLTGVTDLNGDTTVYNYSTAHANLTNWGLFTTMVRPEGNTPYEHRYWFADRRSSSELDSNFNQTIFTYVNATDTTITDPLVNVRTHTHAASGGLSGSTDNAGQNIAIGSDSDGRRSSITDRLGDVTTMSYHAPSGRLASRTHADGTTTSYAYTPRASGANTAYGLSGITHADGSTEGFVYDALGNLTSHTDQLGNTASSTYDAYGQPLTATNRLGGVDTWAYNADETLASLTDPAGNPTSYGYDAFRRPNLITRADSSTVGITYDDADRPLSTTDENGNTTTLSYDLNGNVESIADPLLNTVTFAYDGNDRLLSITGALGGVSSRTYDQLGRAGTATDPLGNVTSYGYDMHNRLNSVTDPLFNAWTTTYDLEGVVASTTDPLLNTTSFVSDKMGRITQITSPLGHTSSIGYDAMGRISTTTNALGNTTTSSRDARGLLTGITLPGGTISTAYTRNALGQITGLTDPNGNSWTSSYDASGRLSSNTDPLLRTTSLSYDNRNRPSVITYPGALGTQTLSFDAAGNLTGLGYTDGTTLGFSYDANDRLIAADSGGPDDVTRGYDANGRISNSNGITIARDLAGRITSMTLAPGKDVNYAYDANDRLITVTDWMAGVTGFSYDAAGRLTQITRPNGVNTSQTWDNDSRLTGIAEGGIASISLSRDAGGQITSATRNVPQAASAATLSSSSNTFDAASQLSGASYDPAGRLTAAGADSYTWDLASRLTSTTLSGNTLSYTYDALDRRISRTAGGVTRDYVWNDALGLASISVEIEDAADLRYYIHTPAGALLYSMDASTNARHFYHYDEMGNTLFVTGDAGTVIGSYAYTPYGQSITATGGLDNPFTWQGRFGVMDEGNGLYYVRARYYDSGAGRFVSRDPVTQTGPKSVNPYQYAAGNPMRFVDPLGEYDIDVLREDLLRAQTQFSNARQEYAKARIASRRYVYRKDRPINEIKESIKCSERSIKCFKALQNARSRHFYANQRLHNAERAERAKAGEEQLSLCTCHPDDEPEHNPRPSHNEIIMQHGLGGGGIGNEDLLLPLSERKALPYHRQINAYAILSKFFPVQESESAEFLPSTTDVPTSNREAVKDPTNPDKIDSSDQPESAIPELGECVVLC